MQSTPAAAPTRTAPLAFWRLAEAFLHTLQAVFGPPQAIARRMLTRRTRALLASWLATGEALMRRLLILEAAAFPKPGAPPRSQPNRTRARRARAFDPDKPETWRVGFRCFTDRRRPGQRRRAAARAQAIPRRVGCGRALAGRYEALIRVFNDPSAAARRLAGRLYAAPTNLRAALKAPPEARRRIEAFDALTLAAEVAARRFNST